MTLEKLNLINVNFRQRVNSLNRCVKFKNSNLHFQGAGLGG
ncbi:hypothetical protein CAMSH0001_0743 [Campylobacter showae RM3277]|uniref:Uncharacterized protein n=1 Tax=Campylobacter showae RM3277 TaxID=553219 RepID=C6RHB6_9BACT|nr:hypothetical protein CAMSH0001_0743 [Campylobacter showae RM3277]